LILISGACIKVVHTENGPDTQEATPSANKQPVAVIDGIMPSTAASGDPVTFNGHGTDVDGSIISYEWRSSLSGTLGTEASFTISSLTAGTHTIYFKVLDSQNLWSEEVSSTVTITAEIAKPVIALFVAYPDNITPGGSIELQWNVTDADTVTIDNGIGEVVAVGSRTLYPAVDTVYTLTASNEGGSDTATASVTVQGTIIVGNPIVEFTATYLGGNSWQLNWNVSNATEIVIEPEIGPVDPTGSTVVTVPSGQTKQYRLTATNDWGWAYHDVIMMSP